MIASAPPTLPDSRAAADVGRRSRLELGFAVRRGRTVLVHGYAEPPLRIGKCLDEDGGLHLILSSSAPGIFGGDHFEQSVVVERGARVRLTSQSSLQVHPDREGRDAIIESQFRIEAGGRLTCEWHPLIPFPASRCRQGISVHVDGKAELFWSDAWMAGREARGERWRFASLAHELRLLIDNQLSYLERYTIEPQRDRPAAAWRAGETCYFGTVVRLSADVDREAVDAAHRSLQVPGVHAAADRIELRLMLVRLMAAAGPPFHAAREAIGSACQPT